jgi:ribosome-binding protein aMBF1 (putative translation factor)
MKKERRKDDAVSILHRRYIGDDAERKASLQEERVNGEVARMIYELRNEVGLKQKELAELIGTTQSVISRLEDADYNGHSLSMLSRIAKALNQKLKVSMTADENEKMRFVFQEVTRGLRRIKGLGIDKFVEKSGIDRADVIAMERHPGYKPSPLVIHKLSKFYDISQKKLAILAGAIKDMTPKVEAEVSRFAAQSESFSKLTDEERKTLDEFVKFLRSKDSE